MPRRAFTFQRGHEGRVGGHRVVALERWGLVLDFRAFDRRRISTSFISVMLLFSLPACLTFCKALIAVMVCGLTNRIE